MLIETDDTIMETYFRFMQLEITGLCNMSCKHCRAKGLDQEYMPLDVIEKAFKFIQKNIDPAFLLSLSGGEPFLHPNLFKILVLAKKYGFENITITTNGSLTTDNILYDINELNLKKMVLQISIDSSVEEIHDSFRGFPGSFFAALDLIKKTVLYKNITASVRVTITPETIDEVKSVVNVLHDSGAKEISFSFAKPIGCAEGRDLTLSSIQRKSLLDCIAVLSKKYDDIIISSSDPLQVSLLDMNNSDLAIDEDDLLLGGCLAGIASFNINVNGDVTPCSMMPEVICNIKQFKTTHDFIKALSLLHNIVSARFS